MIILKKSSSSIIFIFDSANDILQTNNKAMMNEMVTKTTCFFSSDFENSLLSEYEAKMIKNIEIYMIVCLHVGLANAFPILRKTGKTKYSVQTPRMKKNATFSLLLPTANNDGIAINPISPI